MSFNSYILSATSITLDTGNFDYSYARTPPVGDISKKIATTEFTSSGYLALTGGTVTGSVTFTAGISLSTITPLSGDNLNLYYGPSNSYRLSLQTDGNLVVYDGDTSLFSVGGTANIIECNLPTKVPTASTSDISTNAANTQWVNNQDYVKGNLDVNSSNGDYIGLGLFYRGQSTLPCFIYNNGTSNVLVDLATSAFTDGKYLPLAGGTLTGDLTINSDLIVNGNQTMTGNLSLTGDSSTISSARGAINYTPPVGDQSINIANTQFVYNSLQNYVSGILAMGTGDHQGLGLHFESDGTPIAVYRDSSGTLQTPALSTEAWTGENYLALSGGTVAWVNVTGNINCSSSISASNSISAVSGTLSYNIPAGDSSNNIANTKFVTNAVNQEASARNNAIAAEAQARSNADAGKYDKTGGQISGNATITGQLQVNNTMSSNNVQTNFASVVNTPGTSDSSENVANTQWVHNYIGTLGLSSSSSGSIPGGYYQKIGGILFQSFMTQISSNGDFVNFPISFSGTPNVVANAQSNTSVYNGLWCNAYTVTNSSVNFTVIGIDTNGHAHDVGPAYLRITAMGPA